jgi:hypothetical protein
LFLDLTGRAREQAPSYRQLLDSRAPMLEIEYPELEDPFLQQWQARHQLLH